ncbi:MAG: DUF4340 domain-containing protein [Tepidisphaeraceae bacterium]
MNFRTTAILAVILAIVALIVFFTNQGEKPAPPEGGRAVVDVESAKVTKISVTPADGKTLLLEKSGADWKLTQPIAALADSFNVDSLVRSLTELKSRGEASKSEIKTLGLDPPAWKIEVVAAGKSVKLGVGPRPSVGDNLYVLVDGESKPRLISASLCDQLEKAPESYRQNKLIGAAASALQQITIIQPDGKLVMQKKGNDWEMLEPEKIPLDSSAVSDLTFALTGLTAAEFVDEKDMPLIGNPAKSAKRSVWFSTDAPTTQPAATRPAGTTIAFGEYDSILKKNVFVYLDSPRTFAKVAAASLDSFNKKPLDLRDKKVVDITPGEVSRISVATDITATTQPTSRPASKSELVIERRKENVLLGPDLPVGPATKPATMPATTRASTQPVTQPAAPPLPVSNWVLKSQKDADGSNARVDALLAKFNPLRADKYLPPTTATSQPSASYTIEITAELAGKKTVHQFRITDPGGDKPLIGAYKDLRFELPRNFVESITGDFTNKLEKVETPMPANMPPGMMDR